MSTPACNQVEFFAAEPQIGSGTIESAAKQIGAIRMKVAGATWSEDSARQVAKARAACLSDQWDALANFRARPLAA